MKAVCILLCLALVRFSAGHIFRRERYPAMDSLIVDPLDIQQYQQQIYQHRRTPKTQEHQWRRNRHEGHGHSSDSTSNESNSQESKVVITKYLNRQAQNVHNTDRNQVIETDYVDPIVWKSVDIVVNPKATVDEKEIERIFSGAYETINYMSSEAKQTFHQAYEAVANKDNEDSHLNATELLRKYHYNVEEHTIKTEDGYLLTLFRITPKDATTVPRPVVFLMHGLLGSADDWLLMGPGKSLAYLLADMGYDVWLGNARGSKYSRRHVTKHPAQSDFWQFSMDEIALNDLPTMIDFALKTSNQKKLYYVGYSEGTTVLFALTSTRPEYNDKIIMMYALSPVVYMTNVRSPMLRMIAPTSPWYERMHQLMGHGRFVPSKEMVKTLGGSMLEKEIGCPVVSSHINFVMSGVNVEDMDVEMLPVLMSHLPAGASTRQIKQLAQGVATNDFRRYDFGAEMNEMVYGTRQPPMYDMKKVRVPVSLYYSEEDWLAHPTDVQRLEKELINVTDTYKVPIEHFSHMDFQFSKKAPEAVYHRLIDSIQMQTQRNYVN